MLEKKLSALKRDLLKLPHLDREKLFRDVRRESKRQALYDFQEAWHDVMNGKEGKPAREVLHELKNKHAPKN